MPEIEVVSVSDPPLPDLGEVAPGVRRIAVSRSNDLPPLPGMPGWEAPPIRRFFAYDKARVVMSGWPQPLEGDEPREIDPSEASALVERWNAERLAEREADEASSAEERRVAREELEQAQRLRGALLMRIAAAAGVDPYEIATGMGMSPDVAARLVSLGGAVEQEPTHDQRVIEPIPPEVEVSEADQQAAFERRVADARAALEAREVDGE